jgi:hypothetical protein
MKEIQITKYQSDNGRIFDSAYQAKGEDEECRRIESLVRPAQEIAQLRKDIDVAAKRAYDPVIVDTFSSLDMRALFYVKQVCVRFVEKYNDLRMV